MFKKIYSRLFRKTPSPPSPENLTPLLRMLSMTQEDEVSCDDVYAVIDEYAERKAAGENVEYLMPQIAHHLKMCIACREELEALLDILAAQ
jgi:hypothetical protein